jgi:uncharacterized protein YcbK (DUF882 family)
MTWEAKFFSPKEFRCRCKRKECDARPISMDLVRLLDVLRARLKRPLLVTSGTRCTLHNSNVGGTPNSQHLNGLAADVACPSSTDRAAILEAVYAVSGLPLFGRIGIGDTFIHFDIAAGPRVVWLYES